MKIVIEIHQLGVSFGSKQILQNSDFQFSDNKISVLLGPSGCGKSTVLKCIAGLVQATSGEIKTGGKKISYVFQEPRLIPWLNLLENILLPFKLNHENPVEVAPLLETVGLKNSQELFPHELSGGMKMRASIARALISEPEILLLDEPFSALDESLRFNLQNLLLQLQRQKNLLVVFVTHSFSEAVYLGDELFLMAPTGGQVRYSQKNNLDRSSQNRSSREYVEAVQFWSGKLRDNA